MSETRLGTGAFLRRTRISGTLMRALELDGVIRPTKTDTGWRSFGEEDVLAVLAWKAAPLPHVRPRKAASSRALTRDARIARAMA